MSIDFSQPIPRFTVAVDGTVLYTAADRWRADVWAEAYEWAHPGTVLEIQPC